MIKTTRPPLEVGQLVRCIDITALPPPYDKDFSILSDRIYKIRKVDNLGSKGLGSGEMVWLEGLPTNMWLMAERFELIKFDAPKVKQIPSRWRLIRL